MSRNTRLSGTPLGEPLRRLAECLPSSWRLVLGKGQPKIGSLSLRAPDGTAARFSVISRSRLDPRDVALLRPTRGGSLAGSLVLAPFLSPRSRQLLREAGASYADGTGNLRVVLDRPGVFIETEGAQKDPEREPRPLASLKGPAAARVVRALCDFKPPYGVRKLAAMAGTPPASVSRVVSLLRREALVQSRGRGELVSVDWPALLQRWAQDYQFVSSNDVATYLDPRGVPALPEGLKRFKGRYAVTGSLAAARRAPVAPARMAAVYVEDPARAAEALGLRVAEAGGNVMLARPLDPVAFVRAWKQDGVGYAALSQVAVDLSTSPGRGPAEAEELIAWMKRNTDAWRA